MDIRTFTVISREHERDKRVLLYPLKGLPDIRGVQYLSMLLTARRRDADLLLFPFTVDMRNYPPRLLKVKRAHVSYRTAGHVH